MQKDLVVVAPNTRVLNKLSLGERRDIQWLAEMGMPVQGEVVAAIRRVTRVRKEQLHGSK